MQRSKTTFPIITSRVGGDGGLKQGGDVRRINQLLTLAGYLKGSVAAASNVWDKYSAKALEDFYKYNVPGKTLSYIEPKDQIDTLAMLANRAGVLIPISDGLVSESALKAFFNQCVSANYPYGWVHPVSQKKYGDGTKMVWGFEGRPGYAVCTTFGDGTYFNSKETVSLCCTSFVNIVLSLWKRGSIHSQPYEANLMVGGYNPLSLRYGMVPLNDGKLLQDGFCFDLDTLKENMRMNQLYYLGFCNGSGMVAHDTVVLNGYVYECNSPDVHLPSVFTTHIDKRFKQMLERTRGDGGARIYEFYPICAS